MIRFLSLFLLLPMIFSFSAGGSVKDVQTHEVRSELYSQAEIDSAIEVIKGEFASRWWRGCTLTEIYYAGDELTTKHQDWADRNNAEEVLVLLSSFDVDSSGGYDGVLNPDSTYDNWLWILVRSGKGTWKHVDHGY